MSPQFLRLAIVPFIMKNSLQKYTFSWNEAALLGNLGWSEKKFFLKSKKV